MKYLLDTNAWFRLFDSPHKIHASVRQTLQSEKRMGISSFSCIEIAQKHAKYDFLSLPLNDWFRLSLPRGRLDVLPVTPDIAAKAYDLGDHFHGDPADRVITATAILNGLILVTSDRKMLEDPQIKTLSTY